jgi:hypothetical protein
MTTKTVVAIVFMLAALLLGAALLHAGLARGDDTAELICQQLRLGQTPGQIADELHRGDPRRSVQQSLTTIWEDMPDCG